MKTLLIILSGIFFFGALSFSCQHEPELKPGTAEVCFDNDIMLIINSNCNISGCHTGSEEEPLLGTYEDIYRLVVPGKPLESELYDVLTKNPNSESFMPPKPNQALYSSQIDIISLWILQGAKHTTCDK